MSVPDQTATKRRPVALQSLIGIREALSRARSEAPSPAVGRALQMADYYLFLALTYLGYTERLFPEEE